MKKIKNFSISAFAGSQFFLLFLLAVSISPGCRKKVHPELKSVTIPAGEFTIGSEDIKIYSGLNKEVGMDRLLLESERPRRKVSIDAFNMDMFEVTNRAYLLFIKNTGHPAPPGWTGNTYPDALKMHPVTNVSWYDADAFCRSLGKRLPTEEEWEKAARGPNGNRYPWGNEFNIKNANLDSGVTSIIESYPEDASFYGVRGMGGNVMEWTSSWLLPYPGSSVRSEEFGKKNKVIKSWSGVDIEHYNMAYLNARASARHYLPRDTISDEVGFRCAWDARR